MKGRTTNGRPHDGGVVSLKSLGVIESSLHRSAFSSTGTAIGRNCTISLTPQNRCLIITGTMRSSTARCRLPCRLKIFVCAVLMVPWAAMADTYSFNVLPPDVTGPADSTVGWGYEISNQSTTSWLEVTTLNAGVFEHGITNSLFDFPIIAPLTTVSVTFDPINSIGLYELTWDANAPA